MALQIRSKKNMKKFIVVTIILFVVWGLTDIATEQVDGKSSSAPTGKTNAPGQGNCTSCHSGTLNSGTGNLNINIGSGVTKYLPGSTYTVQVDVNANAVTYGFSLIAQDVNGLNAGTINLINTGNTKVKSSGGKTYVSHKNATATSSWQFEWTAPTASVGQIGFYAAGLASDGNSNKSGDETYSAIAVLIDSMGTGGSSGSSGGTGGGNSGGTGGGFPGFTG
ncbi:MAG TPA: hypothetical protein EYQ86_04715, partial [Bacteroidetes bacterium]|nr:hypothetical protein [Bacteroidota bacterium]